MAYPPDYLQPLDTRSFGLGMIYAFAEIVASGCKPLAFSPPLDPEELPETLSAATLMAGEYGVLAEEETTPLETMLFNPEFTRGKTLVLIAADSDVLNSYHALKTRKEAAAALPEGQRSAAEAEIARELGRLLGYSEEVIADLLQNPRF